ncbi:MAG: co-chaperone GroES [Actinomycetia bacterium]|nr:co-chaperone GroES [Actinomycetes bacterium]
MTTEPDTGNLDDTEEDLGTGEAAAQPDAGGSTTSTRRADKVPVRMLSDRILVQSEGGSGERRTNSGILIPATAQLARRLAWAEVRAVGPNVRAVEDGDHVLYNPEEVYEVEVRGDTYIILRERDLHAVASDRLGEQHTGLYL